MKKCEVLELMELQLGRREREERRLRLDLDLAQQELNTLKISRMQIEAEVLEASELKIAVWNNAWYFLEWENVGNGS